MKTDTRQKMYSYIQSHQHVRVHDMVKEFGLTHVAIHKQLKKLLTEGKIQKSGTPPLVYYTATEGQLGLEDIKKKMIPILKKNRIKKAALFGSYVRGDYTEKSDIDVLIAFPDHTTLIDVVTLKQDLEEKLHKKIDLVSYNGIHPLLKDSILNNQYKVV